MKKYVIYNSLFTNCWSFDLDRHPLKITEVEIGNFDETYWKTYYSSNNCIYDTWEEATEAAKQLLLEQLEKAKNNHKKEIVRYEECLKSFNKAYTHDGRSFREISIVEPKINGFSVREDIGSEHFISRDLVFLNKKDCILDIISCLNSENDDLKQVIRKNDDLIANLEKEIDNQ